ncbi:MAG TPA: MFS transporter [Gaiellaceae bacterium]
MLRGIRERLSESLSAFGAVFTNPNLRRVELAFTGSEFGKWLYLVALAVYAYGHGGATAVGIAYLIRTIPSFFVAPFMGALADRYPRERVMALATVSRAVAMGAAAAAVATGAPPILAYLLVALVTLLSTAFRPAQSALLPTLTQTPDELTAANVASSSVASVAAFAGPALGGVLLTVTSVEVVFAATAGIFVWVLLLVGRIEVEREPPFVERRNLAREAFEGVRTIAVHPTLRVLVSLYAMQTLVAGLLGVLVVVAALKFLDLGDSGVGFLNSAIGVGAVLGIGVTLAFVGKRRLAFGFTFGLMLWGIPLIVFGAVGNAVVAYVALGCVGIADTLVEVAAPTMIQRAVPDEVLARVFGVLDSLFFGTIGLGGILAPALVSAFGIRWALIATGLILPVLALVFWRKLVKIDAAAPAPAEQLTLLRQIPLFAPLPIVVVEQLASSLVPMHVPAGDTVIQQGEEGDRFYVIESGELEVSVDGRPVRTMGPGDHFGEIALLRDVPRTATVRARSGADLYALDRDEFIGAVTGHAPSARAADAVIAQRLSTARSSVVG